MGNAGKQTRTRRGYVSQRDPIDALIARIAGKQERLITLVQLYALGLSHDQIRRRVQRGLLHVLHCGVFIVGPPNITPRGHLKGALLTLGEASFLTHRTSLAFQGLRVINTREIELTVIADHTPKRPGLIIHRTSTQPHRHEIRERFGLRYSSLARALIEVAPRETPEELTRLITEGIHKNLVDLRSIQEAIARHRGEPGVGKLRRVVSPYIDTTPRKSGLEISFDKVVGRDPRFPSYEKNVHMGPYEFDVLFRAEKLVVELDGRPYHTALQDMDRDRAKDIWLQRSDIRVMRITDFSWEHERAKALDDLLALLAKGGWIPRAA